jgi:hypothetical protein
MVTIKKIVKKVPNTFKKEVQHVKQTSEPATVPLAKNLMQTWKQCFRKQLYAI